MTDLSPERGMVMGEVASWSVEEIVSVVPVGERVAEGRELVVHASRRADMADVMVMGRLIFASDMKTWDRQSFGGLDY